MVKKIILITGVLILVITTYLIFGYFSYKKSYTDIQNYTIEGFVYDKDSNSPIKNAQIYLENNISGETGIKLDEYEEIEELQTFTNENGEYSVNINKGTFLFLRCSKEGYVSQSEGEYVKKKMKKDFYMEKGGQ